MARTPGYGGAAHQRKINHMPETTLREQCYTSLASDVCPACTKKKKPRQSFCLSCYRKLPRATQQALYNADGYVKTWDGAMDMLENKN